MFFGLTLVRLDSVRNMDSVRAAPNFKHRNQGNLVHVLHPVGGTIPNPSLFPARLLGPKTGVGVGVTLDTSHEVPRLPCVPIGSDRLARVLSICTRKNQSLHVRTSRPCRYVEGSPDWDPKCWTSFWFPFKPAQKRRPSFNQTNYLGIGDPESFGFWFSGWFPLVHQPKSTYLHIATTGYTYA